MHIQTVYFSPTSCPWCILCSQCMLLEDEVRVYAAEMVLAVEHLHKLGIIHRCVALFQRFDASSSSFHIATSYQSYIEYYRASVQLYWYHCICTLCVSVAY